MDLTEIATISFSDLASGGEALAVIRAAKGHLCLCLSLEKDGDVEVVLGTQEFEKFLAALQVAILIVEG